MMNKIVKKISVVSLALLTSFNMVGCFHEKVGGEKLPISGIEEFETYGGDQEDRCKACRDKDVFYNTDIGKMCKGCYKDYTKYINKLMKNTQHCGKCKGVPTTVIEYDRYNHPTETACDDCAEIYYIEQQDRHMQEVIEKADLSREHKRIAKKHARQDAKRVQGKTINERTEEARILTEEFISNVLVMYALSSTKQEAMIYVYMMELTEALN